MGGSNSMKRRSAHDYGSTSSASTARYSPYQEKHVHPETLAKLQMKYSTIGDDYDSLSQVTDALAKAGLESSNLIVGIDFTKSNEWTGRVSFNDRSLHDIGDTPNPYEQAISIIGKTLSAFDEDNFIPCYGFGDATTRDQKVFSFHRNDRPCHGFEEALQRYREIVPHLRLDGPTSFAPMIETAIDIVDNTGGLYHVLLIIADGQVTRSSRAAHGKLNPQEQDTMNAIVMASNYPLSIVMVGVGDGPWDMMEEFDDNIPSRAFDNFQFVNFTKIMSRNIPKGKKETEFALEALMEIPSQYKATIDLQLLGKRRGTTRRTCLPPPVRDLDTPISSSKYSQSGISGVRKDVSTIQSESSLDDKQIGPICLLRAKNLAFGCGHQACESCGRALMICPVCQMQIATRIRLY